MKKSTLLFFLTALVALGVSLYNKRKESPSLALTVKLLGGTAQRLGSSLKRKIAIKGVLSFLGVTLVSFLCKKAV